MIEPDVLKQYWTILQGEYPEIKRIECVTDAVELGKLLSEHQQSDNILLVSLDPHYAPKGGDDSYMYDNTCGLFILEKTDYSDGSQAYREVTNRTRALSKKIMDRMISDKTDGGGVYCNFLSHLQLPSMELSPIRMLNQCNGFYLEFNVLSKP
jgi:hypothetical protein